MKRKHKKSLSVLTTSALLLSLFSPVTAPKVQAENVNALVAENLIISEYIEGSSNNKALELYNGTGSDVDLSKYKLQRHSNGGETAAATLQLSGTLKNGETYVIYHGSAAEGIKSKGNLLDSNVINFNGNDPIVLKKEETIVDSIGKVGTTENWAAEVSLVRRSDVITGDTDLKDNHNTNKEWISLGTDHFDNLGKHSFAPYEQPVEIPVVTVAEARGKAIDEPVAIEGIATTNSGLFGAGELYLQDSTGGMFVYRSTASVTKGDKVKVTGKLATYKSQLQLVPTDVTVVSSGNALPEPQLVTVIGDATQGELLKLERVTIDEMTKDTYGTATIQGTLASGEKVRVIQDNRAGATYDDLIKYYKVGELVHITGIGSVDDAGFHLKTTGLDSFDLVNKPAVYSTTEQGVVATGTKIELKSGTNGDIYYTVDGSKPTNESAKYVGPIELTKEGETTIKAIAVKDGVASEVFSFTYKILNTTGVKIHDIQGKSHVSDYNGATVAGITGVVTHVFGTSSFVIQDVDTFDNDPATSEAIEVSKSGHGVAVGDKVTVVGKVAENGGGANLSTTRINATTVAKVGTEKVALPAPLVVGTDIIPPNKVIDNDSMTSFDPQEDGIDFWESVEYMRVSLPKPVVAGPPYSKDIPLVVPSTTNNTFNVAGGLNIAADDYNPEKIMLDNAGDDYRTGDKFEGDVIGIITYASTGYQVVADKTTQLPALTKSTFKAEVTSLTKANEKLNVASYNVENFSNNKANTPDEKVTKIAKSFVNNMKSPDIITLVEVQDNDGETDSGNADASESYTRLINAIKAEGGPTYKFTDVTPVNNTNGGAPGGNIRVGFIYNPDRVSLVEGTKGNATTANSWNETGSLKLNPGVINPDKFSGTRKPIAAEFEFQGERIVVIGAHLNSKGGDQSLWGSSQPPVLSSETQRLELAKEINTFIKAGLAKNPDLNVLVAGDMNDFEFTPVLTTLKGSELTNMVDKVPTEDRFSYFFQGNFQVLDHILVTNNLVDKTKADMIHINPAFTEDQGQASDHDPVLVQIDFPYDLTVMHTNDTHSAVENLPSTLTAVKNIRAEQPEALLLHAGDALTGTLYFNEFKGKADQAMMNLFGFDAMTFGNHEFDLGSSAQGHQKLADFIKGAKFPFLSANVDFSKDAKFDDLFTDLYATKVENGQIYNGIIKEVNGEKVGIFGLTTEETVDISSPGSIEFENYLAEAKKAVKALEAQGVERIVALTHIGYDDNAAIDNDLILAEKVEGIDVIVGGHSHTELKEPFVVKKDATPTVIVQTGNSNNNLGVLNVKFDDKGVVTYQNGKLIKIDPKVIAADAEAVKVLKPYKDQVDTVSKTEIGVSTPITLESPRTNGDNTKPSVRKNETILGNLITDGMLKKAKSFTGKNVIMALQNGGGIRAAIGEGPITVGEVITVLPFNNTLATMEVTGAELKAAFEVSLSQYPAENGGFLHIAGGKVVYDMKKPAKQRIVSVSYLNEAGKYVEVQDNVKYTIATNAFTAKGGDGYEVFAKAYAEGRVTDLGLSDWENFRDHLVSIGSNGIPTKVEGRIVDVSQVSGGTPGENPGGNTGQNPGGNTGQNPGGNTGQNPGENAGKPVEPKEIKPSVAKNGNKYTIGKDALKNLEEKAKVVVEVDNKINATVTLTKAQIQDLKDAGAALVVSNGNVDVQIPASILPLGENVEIIVKKMEVKGSLGVYDFTIEADGKEYHKFNEKVKLTFKVNPKQIKNPNNVKVYYWNEKDSKWELIGGEYKNGEVTAYTDHFSTYGVFEAQPDSTQAPVQANPELPNTATNSFNLLLAGFVFVLAGSVLYFFRRRNTAAN